MNLPLWLLFGLLFSKCLLFTPVPSNMILCTCGQMRGLLHVVSDGSASLCLESLGVKWKCVESPLCQVSLRLQKKKKKSQMGWVQHYFQENNAMCIIFGPFLIFSFSLSEVPFLFIIPTPPPGNTSGNTSQYFKTQSVVYTSAKSYLPVPAPLVQYSALTTQSSLHSIKIVVTAPWTLHCTFHLFRYSPLPSSLSTPVGRECISLCY